MAVIFKYNSEENKRELIKPGVYGAEITSASLGMSQAGNDTLRITVKPDGSNNGICDHIAFTPGAKWKFKQFVDCFDLAPEDSGDDTQIEIDDEFVSDLLGRTGDVRVGYKFRNGIKINNITEYLPFDEEVEGGE